MGQKDQSEAVALSPVWNMMGGLNTLLPATEIDPTECQACSNMVGYEGKVRPRAGLSSIYAQLASPYASLYFFRHVSNTGVLTPIALGYNFSTNVIKFYEWSGSAWVDRSGALSDGSGALPRGSWQTKPEAINFKGNLYFTTAVDGNLYKWTGTGTTITIVTNMDSTLAPFFLPKHLFSWEGRIVMANCYDGPTNSANVVPYRVAWSDFLIDNVWQAGLNGGSSGFEDLVDGNDEGNDPITGGFVVGQNLFIGKSTCLYYGSNVGYPQYFTFLRVPGNDVGIASQLTVKKFRDTVFFLGSENVYAWKGMKATPIADKIKPRLKAVLDASNLPYACAALDPLNELYYLFVPPINGGGINSKIFIYSIRDNAWWEGDIADTVNILPSVCYTVYNNPWSVTVIMGTETGLFYKLDATVATDNATKFSTSWTSKRMDSMKFFHYPIRPPQFEAARLQRLMVHAQAGSIAAAFSTGPNIDSMKAVKGDEIDGRGVLTFDGKHDKYLALRFTGRFFDMTLSHPDPTPGNAALLEGLTMHITERGAERKI